MASRRFDETVLPASRLRSTTRAMRFLAPLRDGDAQTSLLAIVRNAWYSRVARLLLQQDAVARVRNALDELPIDFAR